MQEVPGGVILRLPLRDYQNSLIPVHRVAVVSSEQLGERLQMTFAQIRKDLSYFGRFGKQGRGYSVDYLLLQLRIVLGLGEDIEHLYSRGGKIKEGNHRIS